MTIKIRKKRSIIWKLPCNEMGALVASCDSYAEVLRHFGLHEGAGNYKTLKRRLEEENIPHPHLKDRKGGVPKGRGHNVRPLEEYLVDNSTIQGGKLKRRLIHEGWLEEKCTLCGLGPSWNGQKLVLTLDHINGDSRDHRIENLRILCPNCHSQTPTFSGKHRKKTKHCKICAKVIRPHSSYCMGCRPSQPTKIKWPPTNQLIQRTRESGFSQVARELGVSDNAIRKHINK